MAKFERWILLTIKFGAPVSLVLFPLVALYGHLRPWAFAEPVLSTYSSQTPVMRGDWRLVFGHARVCMAWTSDGDMHRVPSDECSIQVRSVSG
jgi:hypothetical protein